MEYYNTTIQGDQKLEGNISYEDAKVLIARLAIDPSILLDVHWKSGFNSSDETLITRKIGSENIFFGNIGLDFDQPGVLLPVTLST